MLLLLLLRWSCGLSHYTTVSSDSLGLAEVSGCSCSWIGRVATTGGGVGGGAIEAGFCRIDELLREFHWRALIASTNSVGHLLFHLNLKLRIILSRSFGLGYWIYILYWYMPYDTRINFKLMHFRKCTHFYTRSATLGFYFLQFSHRFLFIKQFSHFLTSTLLRNINTFQKGSNFTHLLVCRNGFSWNQKNCNFSFKNFTSE